MGIFILTWRSAYLFLIALASRQIKNGWFNKPKKKKTTNKKNWLQFSFGKTVFLFLFTFLYFAASRNFTNTLSLEWNSNNNIDKIITGKTVECEVNCTGLYEFFLIAAGIKSYFDWNSLNFSVWFSCCGSFLMWFFSPSYNK